MRQWVDHGLVQFHKNSLGQSKVGTRCLDSHSDGIDHGFDIRQQRTGQSLVNLGLLKHSEVLRRKLGVEQFAYIRQRSFYLVEIAPR